MEYKDRTLTIGTLTDEELNFIVQYGNLGTYTNRIAELQFFYNAIDEEVKRRKLKNKYKNQ